MADRVVRVRFEAITSGAQQAIRRMGTETATWGRGSLQWMQRNQAGLATMGIAFGAFGALTIRTLRNSQRAFADYEAALTRSVSLIGVSREEVRALGDAAMGLTHTGQGPQALADALFFVQSAGFRGQEALDILESSAQAASVGLGDTAVVADLVTSAVTAYGSEVLSASDATDILIGAVREGKAEAPELAGALGRVLPIASEMGVSFDEVGAAVAAMTRTGSDAATATTQLRSIMVSLLRPTQQSADTLAEFGLSAGDLRDTIREDGLWAALMEVRDAVGSNDEALAQIFPNIRALAGFLDLTGANAEETAQIFDRMTDTTGLLSDATEAWGETSEAASMRASAAMERARILVGETVAPTWANFAETVENLATRFAELDPAQRDFMVRGAGMAGAAATGAAGLAGMALIVGRLSAALAGMGVTKAGLAAFMTGPWGIAIATATVLIGGYLNRQRELNESARRWHDLLNTEAGIYDEMTRRSMAEHLLRRDDMHDLLRETGLSIGDVIGALMGEEASLARVNRAIDENTSVRFIEGQGIERRIGAGEDLRRILEDELEAISRSADATLDTATAAEKAEEAYDSWTPAIREALGAIRETNDPLDEFADLMEEGAAATDELAQRMETLAQALQSWRDPLGTYNELLREKEEAERENARKLADAHDDQTKSWEDFVGDVDVQIGEYIDRINEQVANQEQWRENLVAIAQRGRADIARELAEMGPEGAGLVAMFASATEREFADAAIAWDRQVQAGGERAVATLDTQLLIMQRVAQGGAAGTVEAIAEELGLGVTEVLRISRQYGISLAGAIAPLLDSIGDTRTAQAVRRYATGQRVTGLNEGGFVPGPNVDRDVVPAMLTPGEFVFSRSAVHALGADFLDELHRGARGFQRGGRVTGDVRGLNMAFLNQLRAWAGFLGDTYHVTSGFRSRAQQEVLFRRYGPGRAARPGFSMHERGLATDGPRWGHRNPGRFGMHYRLSHEPWHLEPVAAQRAAAAGGFVPALHVQMPEVPDFPFIGIAESAPGAWRNTRGRMQAFADRWALAPAMDTGPVPGREGLQQMAREMLNRRGWGHFWPAFNALVARESSWNPRAQNPTSTAFGLGQFLNSTWATVGMQKTTDPGLQLEAMMRYIARRYGDPGRAWAFWQRNRWYGEGGEVLPVNAFDRGFGVLPRGASIALNNTGAPEPLSSGPVTAVLDVDLEGAVERGVSKAIDGMRFDVDIDPSGVARLVEVGDRDLDRRGRGR